VIGLSLLSKMFKGALQKDSRDSEITIYKQRLEKFNMAILELRRLHNDLIMCYKIIFGLVHSDSRMEDFFQFSPVNTTRGHPYKLFVPQCTLDVREHFFAVSPRQHCFWFP